MNSILAICQKIRNICQDYCQESAPFLLSREIPGEIDILPLIYLLPLREVNKEQYSLAAGLLLTWLSRECHEKVTEDNNSATAKAILYGDLFYSVAYKVYESHKDSATIKEISEIAVKYNQSWFNRQDIDNGQKADKELLEHIIKEDLGLLLEMTAKKAGEEAGFSQEQQEAYSRCSHNLSIIWAQKRYGYDVGAEAGEQELFKISQELGLDKGFREILKAIKQ